MESQDGAGFVDALERHGASLRVLLRRIGSNVIRADQDEEDICQAVLFRAWQLREAFVDRGPGSFRRWLVALARNVVLDRSRYLDARGSESRNAAADCAQIPDSVTSITSRSARREDADRLETALAAVSAGDRSVLELYYLEGESLRDIAQRTGISRSTVWDQIGRAMRELKLGLGGTGG